MKHAHVCLNPYYTGSYSMRPQTFANLKIYQSLNPYYTGSYSMSSCISGGRER